MMDSLKNSMNAKEFWDEMKNPFLASIHRAFLNQELSSFQKQAVIKMLEKKDKEKRFIKNWRPMSLLNTDMKVISKVLSARIKNVLRFLISLIQTTYVKNRLINKRGRVISDFRNIKYTCTRRFSRYRRVVYNRVSWHTQGWSLD